MTKAHFKVLAGKKAVITGGNSGIGLATARLFVEQGAQVAILGRDKRTLTKAVTELGASAVAIQVDISSVDSIENAIQEMTAKLGRVDIVFANAGIAEFAPFDQLQEPFFDKTFDINVKGTFFSIQRLLPHLNDGGSILLNTSIVNIKGMPNTSVYSASKAALRSLTRTLAAELAGRNIRVNAISPGPIDTPIYGRLGLTEEAQQEFAAGILKQSPLKRFGTSEEVAKVALFLATEDSSYITGAEIAVDGGLAQV